MKFFLLINVKMPTIVGSLTFMSGKNSTVGLPKPKKKKILRTVKPKHDLSQGQDSLPDSTLPIT